MNTRKITLSPTPMLNHTHFMPSPPAMTSMTSTSERSELRTTSHHAICKKSGTCSPAPTSTPRENKKLQVAIASGSHSSGTDAKTAEPTRTSGAPSDHSHNIRPTESASTLPFGDISSTSPSNNNTDSNHHNGTLSTVIPTPGNSAIPTATTNNTPGEFGLNDPRFPIPSGPQPSPPKPQAARNKHLPLIIGLVVGLTLFLGVASAIGFYLFKKRRKSRFRYDDTIPLDFSRIAPPPTTTKSFQRKKVTRKPPPPLTLSNSSYAPAVNVVDVNKPLPMTKSEDPPVERDLIEFDVPEDKYYGIALCK